MLIDKVARTRCVSFGNIKRRYLLHNDANMEGLGGVLYQEHPDGWRPVAYASKSLVSLKELASSQTRVLSIKVGSDQEIA